MSTRQTIVQSFVSAVERQLRRYPWLYQAASRILYRVDPSFYTLSPGLPQAIARAMDVLQAEGLLEGSNYYEFGIFRGYALCSAQKAAARLGVRDMHFLGFDSFAGLPKPRDGEQEGSMFFQGQFACSKSFVENALKKNGCDMQQVTLVKGFFNDSLTPALKASLPRKRASIAVVDCDLYSSTVPVLEWLDDLVAPGSIVMMDDWRSFSADATRGQERAFGEWLAKRPDLTAEMMFDFEDHGRAFRLVASHA